jgi:hypothetical protein
MRALVAGEESAGTIAPAVAADIRRQLDALERDTGTGRPQDVARAVRALRRTVDGAAAAGSLSREAARRFAPLLAVVAGGR